MRWPRHAVATAFFAAAHAAAGRWRRWRGGVAHAVARQLRGARRGAKAAGRSYLYPRRGAFVAPGAICAVVLSAVAVAGACGGGGGVRRRWRGRRAAAVVACRGGGGGGRWWRGRRAAAVAGACGGGGAGVRRRRRGRGAAAARAGGGGGGGGAARGRWRRGAAAAALRSPYRFSLLARSGVARLAGGARSCLPPFWSSSIRPLHYVVM
jgi:hypothetical protein